MRVSGIYSAQGPRGKVPPHYPIKLFLISRRANLRDTSRFPNYLGQEREMLKRNGMNQKSVRESPGTLACHVNYAVVKPRP